MIVSCINSSVYPLASFLKDIIDKNLEKGASYIKNSWELVNQTVEHYSQITKWYLILYRCILTEDLVTCTI